jgi:acyl-CoA hydrolase
VNYVGKTSMVIGIRVDSENIQTGTVNHCNSSYFTMVAKDNLGNSVQVPRLALSSLEEKRRFFSCIKRIANRKERDQHEETFDYSSSEVLEELKKYNIEIEVK